ncbi:MAG: DUF1801 domain-containing protein [Bryobacteraceae bacterium]|nr:DUF1801 domain-containing protein [Bryobacteraceae bacterium]
MPSKQGKHITAADSTKAVDEFMAQLDHPDKREIELIRRLILQAHPSVAEGIKWKDPSFRTTESFATMHLRLKLGFGVILHAGAKARDVSISVTDAGLRNWLGKDRAMVEFSDPHDIAIRKAAFTDVLRQWIRQVDSIPVPEPQDGGAMCLSIGAFPSVPSIGAWWCQASFRCLPGPKSAGFL